MPVGSNDPNSYMYHRSRSWTQFCTISLQLQNISVCIIAIFTSISLYFSLSNGLISQRSWSKNNGTNCGLPCKTIYIVENESKTGVPREFWGAFHISLQKNMRRSNKFWSELTSVCPQLHSTHSLIRHPTGNTTLGTQTYSNTVSSMSMRSLKCCQELKLYTNAKICWNDMYMINTKHKSR